MDDELEIKAYYAGHVLGAAMVHIKVGSESVVYTVSVCTVSESVDVTAKISTIILFLSLGRL